MQYQFKWTDYDDRTHEAVDRGQQTIEAATMFHAIALWDITHGPVNRPHEGHIRTIDYISPAHKELTNARYHRFSFRP